MKKIGIIVISALVTLLLLVVTIGNSISNRGSKTQQANTSVNTEVNRSTPRKESVKTEVPVTPRSEMSNIDSGTMSSDSPNIIDMEEVNIDSVPYTNKYETGYATVLRKESYMSNKQLYHSVVFSLETENNIEVNYFMGYSSYNSIEVGDRMLLEYEKFSNGFISIVSISK